MVQLKRARNQPTAFIFHKNPRIRKPYPLPNKPLWVIKAINRKIIKRSWPLIVLREKILRVIKFNKKFEFRANKKKRPLRWEIKAMWGVDW